MKWLRPMVFGLWAATFNQEHGKLLLDDKYGEGLKIALSNSPNKPLVKATELIACSLGTLFRLMGFLNNCHLPKQK